MKLNPHQERTLQFIENLAKDRDFWTQKNRYYYNDLTKFLKHNIPEGSSILEIGCGTGWLLNILNPSKGVGIDISRKMIKIAQKKYGHTSSKRKQLTFFHMDAENLSLKEKFDYIIISDTLGYFSDVQRAFQHLKKVSTPDTRIIINNHSYLWMPFLALAEKLKLKMPSKKLNWLNPTDISNLLALTDFEVIKLGRRFLIPKYIPIISWICNKYLAHFPVLNRLCLVNFIIAKQLISNPQNNKFYDVSIVVPARNEKGNIEHAIRRIPKMGRSTEVIFVEGHSQDGTLEEIKRVCQKHSTKLDVKYIVQDGKGKGDAVRKGFDVAKGDILMILDADLTMPPEDLPKFYNAIIEGKGEFINGSRLVYPLEKEAMRILNITGNKFFSIIFTWLLDQRLKDTLCGTKVLFRKDYEKISANRSYFGEFDPFGDFDLIFGASRLNLKIIEVPIRYKAREYGSTNISRFKHGFLLLKMVLFAMNKIKFI